MKARATVAAAILATFLLAGCSGKPSDSKIESMYKAYVTQSEGGKLLYDKMLEITHFTKLNGFDKDAKTYVVDVTFDRVFTIGSKDIPKTFAGDQLVKIFGRSDIFTNVPRLALISDRDRNRPTPSVYSLYAHFDAGEQIDSCSKYSIEMIKSDNGWIINQVTCSGKPSDNQLANMINAYEKSVQLTDKDSPGVQITEIKNFIKISEKDIDNNTYIAEVKFERIYTIGSDALMEKVRYKVSPEQLKSISQQQGTFKAGDKRGPGPYVQLKFQMCRTPEGWVINQIGF